MASDIFQSLYFSNTLIRTILATLEVYLLECLFKILTMLICSLEEQRHFSVFHHAHISDFVDN